MKMKNLKKALAFTGVLAFLGAGTVFAQDADTDEAADETAAAPVAAPAPAPSNAGLDVAGGKLKIGAYINTGVEWDNAHTKDTADTNGTSLQDTDTTDNTVTPWGQQVNNTGRVQVDLNWTSGDSTFGAKVRLRANKIFDKTQNIYVPVRYAYGWYKPIQYFSVSGGFVDDQAFTTQGDFANNSLNYYTNAVPGGLLHILPLDILDVGFGAFSPKALNNDPSPIYGDFNSVIYYAGLAVNTKLVTLHGSATIEDKLKDIMFSVSTGAVNNLTIALEGSLFDYENWNQLFDNSDWVISAGAQYMPSANLTDAKYGFWGDLNAAYSLGNLGISLLAYYYVNDFKEGLSAYNDWYYGVYGIGDSSPIDFTIQPGVSYSLLDGKVTPGLKFLVGLGNFTFDETVQGFGTPQVKLSFTRIQVNPYVDFAVGPGQIEVGYQLTSDSRTIEVSNIDLSTLQMPNPSKFKEETNVFTNTFYLDFLFKY